MKAILKSFVASALMAVAVVGVADTGHARPKRPTYVTKCTCTCIAFDENSVRYEGGSFTFDTSGQYCTIGINIGCLVDGPDGLLTGAYGSCMGITREEKVRGAKVGLLEPSVPPRPTPSGNPPATRR